LKRRLIFKLSAYFSAVGAMPKKPTIKTTLPGPRAKKLIKLDKSYVSPSYTRATRFTSRQQPLTRNPQPATRNPQPSFIFGGGIDLRRAIE
jgi:hypothetical protein